MKLHLNTIAGLILAFCLPSIALAQTLCPDGNYVSKGPCVLCPNGKYVGNGAQCQLTPGGTYVERKELSSPQLTPNGSYVSGGSRQILCPDGSYVAGSRCVLTPNGKYVGQ